MGLIILGRMAREGSKKPVPQQSRNVPAAYWECSFRHMSTMCSQVLAGDLLFGMHFLADGIAGWFWQYECACLVLRPY